VFARPPLLTVGLPSGRPRPRPPAGRVQLSPWFELPPPRAGRLHLVGPPLIW